MRHRYLMNLASIAVFALVFGYPTSVRGDTPLTIDEIRSVWKERSERIRTSRFDLKVQCKTCKLTYMQWDENDDRVSLTPEETERLANEFVDYEMKYSILFAAPRARCHYTGRGPGAQLRWHDVDSLDVFDGQLSASLSKFQGRSQLSIYADPVWQPSCLLDLEPLRPAMCAADGQLGRDLADYQAQPEIEIVDGIECTVLKRHKSDPDAGEWTESLWIAPKSKDCVAVRSCLENAGLITLDSRCQYDWTHPLGPIPVSWVATNGNHTSVVTVEKSEINLAVSDSDFRIVPPKGAVIVDEREERRRSKRRLPANAAN